MLKRLTLNSIPASVFEVKVDSADGTNERADLIGLGRLLAYNSSAKGVNLIRKALNNAEQVETNLSQAEYSKANEKFQEGHLLYAAKICCAKTGENAPKDFADFKAKGMKFYGNSDFYKVLQGIYEEIVNPILPRVYSEAVSMFADTVEVGFAETAVISIGSNDIPVFQDSAWGSAHSVPKNRFYSKDYKLNPQPKTAAITAKWTQLIGNNFDFGQFFANLVAGMYAKTLGMWNATLVAALSNTALVPSGLVYTFSTPNWVKLVDKVSTVNGAVYNSVRAVGSALALSKVLPTNATGSSTVNTDVDAALSTLLGAEYNSRGHLGAFMGVPLTPLQNAVIPGTHNGNVDLILQDNKILLMASQGRKPLTIAYNRETPITLEFDPTKTADFEIGVNMTMALDSVATFSSKVGVITI